MKLQGLKPGMESQAFKEPVWEEKVGGCFSLEEALAEVGIDLYIGKVKTTMDK